MRVYLYRAALHCEACAALLEHLPIPAGANLDDESSYDSDDYPKGPYPDGGGEADTPQHCDGCDTFLENPLTPDGRAYVLDMARKAIAPPGTRSLDWREAAHVAAGEGRPVLAEWLNFYEIGVPRTGRPGRFPHIAGGLG